MEKIKVLQIGLHDLTQRYELAPNVAWDHTISISDKPIKRYDVALLCRMVSAGEADILKKNLRSYTLFVMDDIELNEDTRFLIKRTCGKLISRTELAELMKDGFSDYFPGSYGERFYPKHLCAAQGFKGKVHWDGSTAMVLEGDFGKEFSQAAYWRFNFPIAPKKRISFWLEYEKSPEIEIALKITLFSRGTSIIKSALIFSEKDMEEPVVVENGNEDTVVFASVLAKGCGTLRIITLHDRYSRRAVGEFVPGGKRYATRKREEVFSFFDPGDFKPPLNVYFSGFRTQEGFEAYNMMKSMEAPFLIFADARLEGGNIYMGSEEYEHAIMEEVRERADQLGFSMDQVILSGISMGSYGALYYGCDLMPGVLLLGKPVASQGDVAVNERINRPGEFPSGFDVLLSQCGSCNEKAAEDLNRKFWDKFDKAGWKDTKFIAAYMYEDDYDCTAYQKIISHLSGTNAEVYGKGLHGRHNDDTNGIVSWFKSQYLKLLREDFGRSV